jgi:hypothetical protein
MTNRINSTIAVIALLLPVLIVRSEVIDRIVVVVDERFIITLSDIRKARAIESALGSDLGNDDAVADLLVEKRLVEEQISQFRTIEIPESEVAERLSTIKKPEGVTSGELREAVESKLRRSAFIGRRFGQFIRPSDQEVADYYQKTLIPELQRRGEPIPALETVSERIREEVIRERMFDEFNDWLAELRKGTTIEKIPQ